MDKNNVEQMIVAFGAIAESMGLLRKELLENGFNEDEVLALCLEALRLMWGR